MRTALEILKSEVIANPTAAMRILLNEPTIYARAGGDTIEVFPCQELTTSQFQFVSMNTSCTQEIPIKYSIEGGSYESCHKYNL